MSKFQNGETVYFMLADELVEGKAHPMKVSETHEDGSPGEHQEYSVSSKVYGKSIMQESELFSTREEALQSLQ